MMNFVCESFVRYLKSGAAKKESALHYSGRNDTKHFDELPKCSLKIVFTQPETFYVASNG